LENGIIAKIIAGINRGDDIDDGDGDGGDGDDVGGDGHDVGGDGDDGDDDDVGDDGGDGDDDDVGGDGADGDDVAGDGHDDDDGDDVVVGDGDHKSNNDYIKCKYLFNYYIQKFFLHFNIAIYFTCFCYGFVSDRGTD